MRPVRRYEVRQVDRAAVCGFVRDVLGYDTADVVRIEVNSSRVLVEVLVRDIDGNVCMDHLGPRTRDNYHSIVDELGATSTGHTLTRE